MVKSFQNVEPIPPPQHSNEDLFGQQVPPTLNREIPFKVIDRADKEPDQFESIAHLFRHRANLTRLSAFSQVDNRGKESTLTWEKLSTRAEKVAHVLVDKSGLAPGDRVGLFYKTFEILDFIVALFGCFLAGLVAVPIQTDDLAELWFILRVTQIHLVLTTDTQLKTLTKQLKAKSLDFPKDVEWWPTHDFGSLYTHQIKTGHYSSIRPCHLAYIEFTKSMNGELKGCAVSHLAIMHTCHTFVASTTDTVETQGAILPNWDSQGDIILSSIESRQQLGLIVLLTSVYSASHTLLTCSSIMETPQVWVYLVSKYKATIGLLNYPGLNSLIRQQKDMQFNKKNPPDLSSIRLLLIDTLQIQPHPELLEPFGLNQGVITPIASLPTHAGLILAFRDFLGSEKSREMWECTLNTNALKEGRIVLANEGYRATSHGFPFAQSSVVIVDPETTLVCPANKMGEIWISSQGAPDLFWGIPSESALKASAQWVTENTVEILPGFVRTGLLGTLIGGRLIVLSKFEECVRQDGQIFFGHDLINTLKRKCQLNACTLFSVYVNRHHLAVLAIESTQKLEQAINVLLVDHGLRLFAAFSVQPGHLPRFNDAIHPLETKRRFLTGQLAIQQIKMDMEPVSTTTGDPWKHTSYDLALSQHLIVRGRAQHSGIEKMQTTIDERSNYDLSKFTNMADIMLWRTSLYADENAFVLVTNNNTKPISWKKINSQVATLAHYLHKKQVTGKVLLWIPFGLDLIRAIYACFVLGLIPVIGTQELEGTLTNLSIKTILISSQSQDIKTSKKKNIQILHVDKAPKFNKLLGPESGYSVRSEWTSDKSRPAMIVVHPSTKTDKSDYVVYGHDTILAQCRTQKLTCQIKYTRPLIVTSMGGLEGLGLLYAAFCGVYVGCATLLMPEFDPNGYFELISRNKCLTVCANYPLMDQSIQRIPPSKQNQISLVQTQNMMMTVPSRTKPRFYEKVARFLSLSGLERSTINTVYSHPWNPMITTRSYMLIEPIPLIVDFDWLRQGIIRPLVAGGNKYSVLLHDSGMVPTNTMVAIVNPRTRTLCPAQVLGEVWVASDGNVRSATDPEQFEATLEGDSRIKYMRTGDLGFLWHVQRQTVNGQAEEGQCLYVLGHLSEVLMSKGLIYFAVDVEETVETCHPSIWSEGCYIIQIDLEIVVVVAVRSNEFALSMIPLIVSAILERHDLLIDTIVIINKDQLPKKHNGEKKRKKVLSMYLNKELSAIYVSRIKNQHQPILLPQRDHIQDDTASVISFGQTSHYDPDSASLYRARSRYSVEN